MIYNERDTRKEVVCEAAKQIMMAARTAPKGKGVDIIEIATVTGDDLLALAHRMREESEKRDMKFSCAENPQENPCAINSIDVGIAIGSACSKAADMRIDTRVMFSAGAAAQEMNLLPGCRQVIALALSVSSKSPFFDRKPQTPKA